MGFYFKKLAENAIIPTRGTPEAAGMDLYANEDIEIPAGEYRMVGSGIALQIPSGYQVEVRPRSGLAAKFGVTVLNSPGTIDSDYRGECKAILINHGKNPFAIKAGDRIAQLVLMQAYPSHQWQEATELNETERGSGGFGSTGR